ncbi:MAG: S8 family serine peptidase [Hymenobacteraceae bacterium]|nr:S8 family serine peptidase [Hymenobacteraceae bacterium]MDX5397405.1 S8 family serine peptidase [Hymenobacteraceae bacterium]MDX5513483.1 S8 family serine peptidase [Hymenobacteraceae bacterium]
MAKNKIKHLQLIVLCVISCLVSFNTNAQTGTERKHLIYFKDKAGTPFSVSNPEAFLSERALQRRARQNIPVVERDLPVSPQYVAALHNLGADVWYTSRWFNAAVVSADSALLAVLQAQPFVESAQTLNLKPNKKPVTEFKNPAILPNNLRLALAPADYGVAYHQANMIGAVNLHQNGFKGEGMMVAVFDAGFPGVNTVSAFQHLYQNNQLVSTYNFVDRNTNVYQRSSHGTNVLSTMAAYDKGRYIGTAFEAKYLLFITEDADTEHNIEEVNWLIAAERADSAGVDVINSSLGYTTFDAPSRNYSYQDMNGNTTIVTRAADFAAATGMLVVNSAGNEGNQNWRFISAPADGDSVLAVGAVDSLGRKAGFSSFGPTADGRIKPNLAAQGFLPYLIAPSGGIFKGNGTSFSGPILCGMATCFWQANYSLSNIEIIRYLQQSASQANNPDNNIGYGIPNAERAFQLALQDRTTIYLYPNPLRDDLLTVNLSENFRDKNLDIKIYDMIGREVYDLKVTETNGIKELVVPTGKLQNGMYVCVITHDSGKKAIRFVKL